MKKVTAEDVAILKEFIPFLHKCKFMADDINPSKDWQTVIINLFVKDENDRRKRQMRKAKEYKPQQIDTTNVVLPNSVMDLVETLAANNHDGWAIGKMAKGYVFGETTSDEALTHADLIPYEDLTEEKKDYDRNSSMDTIKALYALGYEIRKADRIDEAKLPYQHREENRKAGEEFHPIG